MPRIFGQELTGKQLWIGGLIAAAVAVVVFLRARAASAPTMQAEQPADYGEASGGLSVPAPSQQVADQYQQQLQNAELEAAGIANAYQKNLLTQQQKQFDFQMSQQELLAPAYRSEQQAELAAQEHYYKTVAKTKISCPKGQGVAQDTSGQLYCRQKSSGIPIVTDLIRTASGIVYGAAAAAPSIGYQGAQAAATYYTGKVFATGPAKRPKATEPMSMTSQQGSRETLNKPSTTQKVGTGGYFAAYQDLP
jgi:hypothetical protein